MIAVQIAWKLSLSYTGNISQKIISALMQTRLKKKFNTHIAFWDNIIEDTRRIGWKEIFQCFPSQALVIKLN